MLETIRNCGATKIVRVVLLASGICALTSCATKQEPQIVDSGARQESSLPWNKQEKWEGAGAFGGMSQQMQESRR